MKAMIFAAGLGTRLRPMTDNIPKALVPYKSKPLLQIVIEKLKSYQIYEFVINVHHFSQKIIDFLQQNNNFGCKIDLSDETDLLLDTGGGLFKAKELLNSSTFLVHNVDIISDLDISKLLEYHQQSKSTITLAVQNRNSDKKLYFSAKTQNLCLWRNEITNQERIVHKCKERIGYAYSGIFAAEPLIFDYMHQGVYSIIDTFLAVAKDNKVTFWDHTNGFWRDMGKPDSFID